MSDDILKYQFIGLWVSKGTHLYYSETLIISIYCPMRFSWYPFDTQVRFSFYYNSYFLVENKINTYNNFGQGVVIHYVSFCRPACSKLETTHMMPHSSNICLWFRTTERRKERYFWIIMSISSH